MRAGTSTAFYTGDTLAAAQILLGISKNPRNRKRPTGGIPPNAFGFYDMLVQTYCQDPVYVLWTTDPKAWKVVPAGTPGALARRVAAILPDREPVHEHPHRGLDHGAWVPLKVMYPLGDVPALQLSLPTHDPGRLLDIGRRLRPLRAEGVLVIGSGFMTHGLPFLTREMLTGGAVPSWSADFDAWAADALNRGDVDTLAAYRSKAPGMPYAHPTVDHYIPLFITLGAAEREDQPVDTIIEGYMAGLSRRSFQVN